MNITCVIFLYKQFKFKFVLKFVLSTEPVVRDLCEKYNNIKVKRGFQILSVALIMCVIFYFVVLSVN